MAYPEYTDDESRAATAFIRSHELEILTRARTAGRAWRRRSTHVNPARPVVKVRVYSEAFGVVLNVDVPLGRYAELRLAGRRHGATSRRGRCGSSSRTTRSEADGIEEARHMNSDTVTTARTRDRTRDALDRIHAALRGLRYGTVTAVVQDGVVVQVERTEKIRLEKRERQRDVAGAPERIGSERPPSCVAVAE